jgi:hypothetical protein
VVNLCILCQFNAFALPQPSHILSQNDRFCTIFLYLSITQIQHIQRKQSTRTKYDVVFTRIKSVTETIHTRRDYQISVDHDDEKVVQQNNTDEPSMLHSLKNFVLEFFWFLYPCCPSNINQHFGEEDIPIAYFAPHRFFKTSHR